MAENKAKSETAQREEAILAYWHEKQIFAKSLEKTKHGKEFVFYDGPPFATGEPHYGHILPGTMKDVIPRFQTMRGRYVRRRWGWDCHGLPIENIVEKELGLKSKKDIETYGIQKFNEAARRNVMRFADDWRHIIPRTGRFVDMHRDYKTMNPEFTESVWWSFKELYKKGLVYEGFKPMHICPHCETTLSNFEVNQGYKDITDISVYVKCQLKDAPSTYLVAWTTTPWTLPGNAALAVNPDLDYVTVEAPDGAKLIIAKSRLEAFAAVTKLPLKTLHEEKGTALVGRAYVPLFPYYASDEKLANRERGWKVYAASFVTAEDGTGIVHIAPAFGADDMELGQKERLPFIQHVHFDGTMKAEVKEFAGLPVKPKPSDDDTQGHQKTDIEIIKYLAHAGALLAKEKLVHSYPHCWRCDTPLLNYAASSWFIKVTALKDRLVAANKKVRWIPDTIGQGRFGNWLLGAKDWAISRSRFWGAPLPVWRCEQCKKLEVVGSLAELKSHLNDPRAPQARNTYYVMRHGEAENVDLGIVANQPDKHGLVEAGKKQARESALKLKEELSGAAVKDKQSIDVIFVSPYLRTRQTAEIAAKVLGVPAKHIITEPALAEINAGVFAGDSIEEYTAYFHTKKDYFEERPPEGVGADGLHHIGESRLDVKKRIGTFLYSLNKQYQGKNILIVTHDSPAWMLFAAASDYDLKETEALRPFGKRQFFLQPAEVRPLPFVPMPHNDAFALDLHRPYIDAVTYRCGSCEGTMKRVPDVFDTWYDSGSMPFASNHYPFETDMFNPKAASFVHAMFRKGARKNFPADFIAEGLDQTRGWFYTLLVLSVALFGKAPYKNVLVNGLVLAEDGKKMSKRLKNYPELMGVIDTYGADALRYFLMASPAVRAEDVNFSEKGVDEVRKKLILRLQNVVSFYELYGEPASRAHPIPKSAPKSDNVLDQWILARLAETVEEVTVRLEHYEIDKACVPLDAFIDDLSTWYIRRSRDRFKPDNHTHDRTAALATTRYVLVTFAKVLAPVMPFTADDVYLKLRAERDLESVHLEAWPSAKAIISSKKTAKALLSRMALVRTIVTEALEARAKTGLKVRQPLSQLTIADIAPYSALARHQDLLDVIALEVNVKSVVIGPLPSPAVDGAHLHLDSTVTPELREEGIVRELIRAIQDLRKQAQLTPGDRAVLTVNAEGDAIAFFKKYESEIVSATTLSAVEYGPHEGTRIDVAGIVCTLHIAKAV
jgi:isoleucyl-tRNA synthetase